MKKFKAKYQSTNNLNASSEEDGKKRSQRELRTINDIETDLQDLEVRVTTFEDAKSDPKYRELDGILKGHWSTLDSMRSSTEETRRRKLKAIDLVKKMLRELNAKAEENTKQIKAAIEKINIVDEDVETVSEDVYKFDGTKNDDKYNNLDQKLRNLWSQLNDIRGTSEDVMKRKERTITEIQNLLKTLVQNAQQNENGIVYGNKDILKRHVVRTDVEDIPEKQPMATPRETLTAQELNILTQTKEFENHWNAMNAMITRELNSGEKHEIVNILNVLSSDINKKIHEIQRISTNSFRSHGNTRVTQPPKYVAENDTISFDRIKKFSPENMLVEELASLKTIDDSIEIKTLPTTEIFGRIQRIQRDTKETLCDIDDFSGTKEGPSYQEFHWKLKTLQKELEEIPINLSLIIDNARDKALNLVKQANEKLEDKVSKNDGENKTLKENPSNEEIVKYLQQIQKEVKDVTKQIKEFNGSESDSKYYDLQSKLDEFMVNVEEIATNDSMMVENSKDKALKMIADASKSLDDIIQKRNIVNSEDETHKVLLLEIKEPIKEEATKQKSEETIKMKAIVEMLQKLKKKVDCFYGTYKNIQYVQIEKELEDCLENLSELDSKGNEKIESNKNQIKQKILQYLSILDEKSLKVHSEDNLAELSPKQTPYEQISELRDKLSKVKSEMENFTGAYKDEEYIKIETKTISYKTFIDEIHDLNDSIKTAKDQYTNYVNELLQYFKDKVFATNDINQDAQMVTSNIMALYNEEILNVKKEILALHSPITQEEYDIFDEKLMNILKNVNDVNLDYQGFHDAKRNVMEDIQILLNFLKSKRDFSGEDIDDEILKKIQDIENGIVLIAHRIEAFKPNPSSEREYDRIDEEMSNLLYKIQTINSGGNIQILQICSDLVRKVQNSKIILNDKNRKSKNVNKEGED